jgi:nucleoside phosphorylase
MTVTVAALRTELLFAPRPRAALGVGQAARVGLRRVLARWRPTGVVVVGYSGGLHASLSPRTLLLPDRLLGPKGVVRTGAAALARAAEILPQAKVGPVITVDRAAAPWDKAALGVDAFGVDLESALLGEELFRQGIPFLVVRIVFDALWESVPTGWSRGAWAGRALACSWRLGQAARLLRPALAACGGNPGGADPRCSPPNPDGKSSLPPRAPRTRRKA